MRTPLSDRARQRLRTTATIVVTALVIAPAAALATHSFSDVDDSDFFHAAVDWMKDNGVTVGCNPPSNTRYCPDDFVTRGEMAVFLERLDSQDVFLRPGDGAGTSGGDADTLDGKDSTAFLGVDARATDANLLDGQDSTAFLGVNATARNADRLDGKDSTAFLSSSGESIFQLRDWNELSPDALIISEFTDRFSLQAGSSTAGWVTAYPDLPKQLFGVTMAVKQFELCYTTPDGGIVSVVSPEVLAEDGDAFAATVATDIDFTDRTDDSCRLYVFDGPVPLTTDRYFAVRVAVNVGATNAKVHLTKATVTLVPA